MATTDDDSIIRTAMLELAKDVVKKAGEVDILADKIDALKALTTAYAALKKHKTDDPDEDQGNDFDFKKGVGTPEESPDESTVTPIRSRRRPG